MIVGTAGHVNHGKTSLVRALTGVDLDVLEEEQRRGMTIQLGFAEWRPSEHQTISIVDVPGHARFAHTMATGALGLDAVMLVVAADEGVMPQTREHLNACKALDIDRGVVALTRIDRVDDVDAARTAVARELQSSLLADAPIIPVCAPRGEGLAALADAVACLPLRARGDDGAPAMLPIDRVFSVRGVGAVVTGSLLRGSFHVDQQVVLLPADHEVRIRGIQVHGEAVASARAGQRVALNLAGVEPDTIARSGFVAARDGMCIGRAFDAELCWLEHMPRPIKIMRSLGFVSGAVRASARVQADAPIAPGETGVARVVLDRDVPLSGGLRFVLRGPGDAQFGAVVGGGRVIDASPAPRRAPRTRAALRGPYDDQLNALIEEAGRHGLSRAELAARLGCAPLPSGPPLFAERIVQAERERVLQALREFEAKHPMEEGMPIAPLRLRALEEPVLAALVDAESIAREGALIRSRGRDLGALRAAACERAEALYREIAAAGLTGLEEKQLAQQRAARELRDDLIALETSQRIVRVAGTCFEAACLHALAKAAAAEVIAKGTLPVSWTKDHAGVSRKHAMVLWTHLDRLGVTQRKGEGRVAGPRAAKLASEKKED